MSRLRRTQSATIVTFAILCAVLAANVVLGIRGTDTAHADIILVDSSSSDALISSATSSILAASSSSNPLLISSSSSFATLCQQFPQNQTLFTQYCGSYSFSSVSSLDSSLMNFNTPYDWCDWWWMYDVAPPGGWTCPFNSSSSTFSTTSSSSPVSTSSSSSQ